MNFSRRGSLRLAAGLGVLSARPRNANAQPYPSRPLRIVVGFPPGAATDIDMRLIAQWLSPRVAQQVVVDNRPGAGSNLAAEEVVRSAPDGYTLLALTVTNSVNATLYQGLSFDIVRDVAPVAGSMRTANVLVVHPSLPARTVPELIAYAKAHPGKINYASGGYGSAPNMAAELFKMMAGVDLVHVPYRGSTIPDLLAGQVEAEFTPIPLSIGYIRDGKLRALAVTGTARSAALPDVPTVAEFLPGYVADVWHGIAAPKRTPADIVSRLNKEINAILAEPTTKERFAQLGAEPMPMTAEELGKLMIEEIDKWGKVVKFAGLKPG